MAKKAKALVININGVLTKGEVEDGLNQHGIKMTDYAVVHDNVEDSTDEIGKALTKHMKANPGWGAYNTTLTFQFSDGTKAYICLFDMH